MIEKSFRKHDSMVYRRRYKCPMCGNYSLWIPMDILCECSDCEADLSIELIEKLIGEGDYNGFFEKQELEDLIYFSIDGIDAMLEKCGLMKSEPFSIKEKVNIKIDSLYKRTCLIDGMLDDFISKYNNSNTKRGGDEEFDDFDYLITIIEEINHFLNMVCKDINLYDASISKKLPYSELNYSGTFYANNAIDHLFQADERILVVLGIIMGYPFANDFSKNVSWKIRKYIRKHSLYKQNYKKYFDKLYSDASYQLLKRMRNFDEHDLTFVLKMVIDENIDSSQDRETIDKILFEPLLKDYIFCVNELYVILEQIIKDVETFNISSLSPVPMRNKYLRDDIYVHKLKKYDYSFYEKLEKYRLDLGKQIASFCGNIRIIDVYFRLDEVCHCIRDIYNGDENSISINGFDGFVDMEYIVYSALIRIYSCYDKIAKYLSTIYPEFSDVKYFEDLENKPTNREIYRSINTIFKNENYKLLYVIRNMLYHNIRFGAIFGKKAQNHYLCCCTQIVLENTYILYEFLDKIKPVKKVISQSDFGGVNTNKVIKVEIERNAPCPCGSGRKYKKCCMGQGITIFNGLDGIN